MIHQHSAIDLILANTGTEGTYRMGDGYEEEIAPLGFVCYHVIITSRKLHDQQELQVIPSRRYNARINTSQHLHSSDGQTRQTTSSHWCDHMQSPKRNQRNPTRPPGSSRHQALYDHEPSCSRGHCLCPVGLCSARHIAAPRLRVCFFTSSTPTPCLHWTTNWSGR